MLKAGSAIGIAAILALATPAMAQQTFWTTCKAKVPAASKLHVDGPAGKVAGGFYACGGPDLFHYTVPADAYLCINQVVWYGLENIYANLYVAEKDWQAHSFDRTTPPLMQPIVFEPGDFIHFVLANGAPIERYVTVTFSGYLNPDQGQGLREACR